MEQGFLPLSRQLFDHEFWKEKRTYSRGEAWIDLIQMASWQDGTRLVKGKLIPVRRGELIGSLRFLGGRWDWSPMKVDRFLDYLKNETMARQETRQGETVVIITNYDTYNNITPTDETTKKLKTRQSRDKVNKENKENQNPQAPSPDGGGDERFKPVTDGYCAAFLAEFGEDYAHSGGRDGKAVKELLATLAADKFSAERIIKTARAAMALTKENRFSTASKQARTLSGFCGAYNEIRAEVVAHHNQQKTDETRQGTPAGGARKPANNRNTHTANAGDTSDYRSVGKVARRTDEVRDATGPAVGGNADGGGDVPA